MVNLFGSHKFGSSNQFKRTVRPHGMLSFEELEERILYNYEAIAKKKSTGDRSARGKMEVSGSQYIWYDITTQSYSVGTPSSPNPSEPRAKKLRKLNFYKGKEAFDENLFLELLAVQFVRNKQYTVYPYPFDLIRLYCENESYA